MFELTVRDRVMIAHSFRGELFGPAQGVHGATFVVDASFQAAEMDEHNLVIDICLAHEALNKTLSVINYKNLDELDIFSGENTTTEIVREQIASNLCSISDDR